MSKADRRRYSCQLEEGNPYTMTEEILRFRSRFKVENRGVYIKQFYCGVTSSIGAISFGIVLAWASPSIFEFADEVPGAYLQLVTLITAVPGAASFGMILAGVLVSQYGPRKVGLVMSSIQTALWILIAVWENVNYQYVALFLNGVFSTCTMIVSHKMLYDCVHEVNWYHLFVIFRSSLTFGVALAFIVRNLPFSYLILYKTINACIPASYFVLLFFCKESPVFLYNASRKIEARNSLKFYRGTENVNLQMRSLQKDAERALIQISGKYMLMHKVVFKAVLIITALKVFQVFSGYYAFIFFGTNIGRDFVIIGSDVMLYDQMWEGLFRILTYYFASVISSTCYSRFNYPARKVLITSSILVTISLTMLSVFFYCVRLKLVPYGIKFGIKVLLEICFICSFESGLSIYPDLILYDYLPFQVYPWIIPYLQSFYWLNVCLLTHLTRALKTNIPIYGYYLLLAGISFCGCLFSWFFVIECKGLTLLQIQMKLGGQPVGSRISHLIRYKKYYG